MGDAADRQADAPVEAGSLQDDACPMCGATSVRVEEDVSDEVTVYACGQCESTWAVRSPEPGVG